MLGIVNLRLSGLGWAAHPPACAWGPDAVRRRPVRRYAQCIRARKHARTFWRLPSPARSARRTQCSAAQGNSQQHQRGVPAFRDDRESRIADAPFAHIRSVATLTPCLAIPHAHRSALCRRRYNLGAYRPVPPFLSFPSDTRYQPLAFLTQQHLAC